MQLMDGKQTAQKIQEEIKKTLQGAKRKPGLALVLVGEHAPSQTYIKMKKKACANVGIESYIFELSASITEEELLQRIAQLNEDPLIDGILLQLPLPEHINELNILMHISPEKDVDGLHPINVGKMLIGDKSGFLPCTPLGIKTLLLSYGIPIARKHVVVVGRSNIVGKPIACILLQKDPECNATVTIAHSQTPDLKSITKQADILIVAIGQAFFITKEMVKEGAVVVDVGINRIKQSDNKDFIIGDVDFDNVAPICSYITPVPKGIGPMTIASLLQNTLKSYLAKEKLS